MEESAGPSQEWHAAEPATCGASAPDHREPAGPSTQLPSSDRAAGSMPETSDHEDLPSTDAQHAHSGRSSSPDGASQQPSAEARAASPTGECSDTPEAADGAAGTEEHDSVVWPTAGLCRPCVTPADGTDSPWAAARRDRRELQRQQASAGGSVAAVAPRLPSWQPAAEARTSRDPRLGASAMPQVPACGFDVTVPAAAVGGCCASAAPWADDKPAIVGVAAAAEPADREQLPWLCPPATPMAAAQEPPVASTPTETPPVQPSPLASPALPQPGPPVSQQQHTMRNVVLAVRWLTACASHPDAPRLNRPDACLNPIPAVCLCPCD